VSSILDALAKVEAARPRPTLSPTAPAASRAHTWVAGAVLVAFACGAAGAYWWSAKRHRVDDRSAAPADNSPATAPKTALLALARPVPAPTGHPAGDRPWGEEVRTDVPPPVPPPVAAAPPAPRPAIPILPSPPRVRVSFLVYSRTPERRTVTVSVDDGNLLTLREGDASGGMRVVQILPDRVELDWAGSPLVVRARE